MRALLFTARVGLLALAVVGSGCQNPTPRGGPSTASEAAGRDEATLPEMWNLAGVRLPGGAPVHLSVDGTTLSAVEEGAGAGEGGPAAALSGGFVVPAFVDAHVHLAYWPVAAELPARGLAAVVDLGAPLDRLPGADHLEVVQAGPFLAAPGGYPTESWGADGYGVVCASEVDVDGALEAAAGRGVRVLKLSLGQGPDLPEPLLRRAISGAHARGWRVAVHALTDEAAARAAALSADVLAHTPVEPLSPSTVEAWAGRAVISTLEAFGGSAAAIDNLRRLREAGATVLYGTDMGNARTAGISATEIALLKRAGLDDAAILEAATVAPATFFGLDRVGTLEVGKRASFLVVVADPQRRIETVLAPRAVVVDGRVR